MLDAKDIVSTLKKVALDAVDARCDCDYMYGTVISEEPLIINIAQGIDLTSKQLELTRNVTNYSTTVTIEWVTESKSGGSGQASYASHNHDIKGTKEIIINNALQEGDKVILFRKKGGQKYLVLDRVVS